MADPTSGNTTIGIELEFLFLAPRKICQELAKKHNWSSLDHAARYMIYEALDTSFRTPCWVEDCHEEHERFLPLRPFDQQTQADTKSTHSDDSGDSDEPIDDDPLRTQHSGWIVAKDCSLTLSADELATLSGNPEYDDCEFHVINIEIKSRIMNFNKPTPCPGIRGRHDDGYDHRMEISHVIAILHTYFNNPTRPGYRMVPNSSCGLHVHVGGQPRNELPHIARGVMAMSTAFERQLDRVLTLPRISGYTEGEVIDTRWDRVLIPGVDEGRVYNYPDSNSPDFQHRDGLFCRSLSFVHIEGVGRRAYLRRTGVPEIETNFRAREEQRNAVFHDAQSRIHIPAWNYISMATRTVNDLRDLWVRETGHTSTVNFDNIMELPEGEEYLNKWTIEYRSHPGTLESEEILAWVDWTAKLTETCRATNSIDTMEYISRHWADPDFTLLDLLRDVDCTLDTQQFYASMLSDDYATNRLATNLAHLQLFPATNPLAPLLDVFEHAKFDAKLYRHTEEKIRRKFDRGLYGKFPRAYVQQALPPGLRSRAWKLCIGVADGVFTGVPSTDPVGEYETQILDIIARYEG